MLILSGKEALKKEVGEVSRVEDCVVDFIASKQDYEIEFCYFDTDNKFGVKPVKNSNKKIRDFITNLEKRWGEIDYLLLLGGDRVIPFFRLTNPCDDGDEAVLSDSPYASRDEDFLIPERCCARIPDNHSADFIVRNFRKSSRPTKKAFGITALSWKEASVNVYRQIGKVRDLKTSPPIVDETFKSAWLEHKDFLYFNLHGSKISPNWYGQNRNSYPVALRPTNIVNADGVVVSEACYGAYVINKSVRDSNCLKFLDQASVLGFCGSTTIAYGPPTPPSSEADLLVKYLFEYLQQGLTLGQSFKNAKIDFARKSLRRFGFLDDDDQKTLLQFVLFGDPTLKLTNRGKR